jgi:mannose-6-phosphate isomerase-like protein (cupin superfamily)
MPTLCAPSALVIAAVACVFPVFSIQPPPLRAQGVTSAPSKPLVIRSEDVSALPAPGCGTTKFLVTGDASGGSHALLDSRQCQYVTGLHRHNRSDESFFVMEGALNVFVDGMIHRLRAGDYVFVPRGTPHAQGNPETVVNRVLVTLTPAGYAQVLKYRAELLTKLKAGSPDYEAAMAERRKDEDIELLGPTPAGLNK